MQAKFARSASEKPPKFTRPLQIFSYLTENIQCKFFAHAGVKRKRAVATESGEPRKKRVRTNYTKEHLQQLEAVFAQTQYPDLLMREQIAEQLEVTEQKIHVSRQHC